MELKYLCMHQMNILLPFIAAISLFVGSGSLQTVISSPDQRTEGAVDPGRGKATNPRGN